MLLSLLSSLILCQTAPAAVAQPAVASAAPELILHSGRIATLARGEGFVEALAIQGGRVHTVGGNAEVRALAGEGTRSLDLGGRTVIPGLNDSHLHAVRGGRFYNLELRWDGVTSLARGLEMIREQAQRTPPGQWVRVVGGFSPFQFAERRLPTIAELNAASPERPVFVLFLYSQGLLNAAGVQALGLTPESTPPPGGQYRFVDGGAELLALPHPGILYGTVGKLPSLSPEDQLNSSQHFFRELNRFGLTSAVDAGGGGHAFPEDYDAAAQLAREGRVPLRLSLYLFAQKEGRELADLTAWTREQELGQSLALGLPGGYEIDGAGENLVWAAGDFENFLAPRPDLERRMDQSLTAVVGLLARERWPFRIHATYGESIERLLGLFEKVDAEYAFNGLPWWIDHAETIQPTQIQRVQRLGGGIAIQNRMAFAGEYFLERYGAELAAEAPPLRRLLDSGIPLGAGTDATRVSSHNPWLCLHWLVTGETLGGTVLAAPHNRLSRLEALELYTLGSARVAVEERQKGALIPGFYGDLAVLDRDYFQCPTAEIRQIESLLTVVGGRIVYAAGPYGELCPELPAVSPAWSPVAHYGGYQRASEASPPTSGGQ
jgi:hypothetical protein